MFAHKPNFDQAQEQINAFWHHQDTGRPYAGIVYSKPGAKPFPSKQHNTIEDYWLDLAYRAEATAHDMENSVFYADAMPVHMPNLGPGIFSAWAGCPYIFGQHTAWTEPCITDWANENAIADANHPLAKKLEDYTRILLEKAKGKFIVGLTDFHPGGDHLAALRGSLELAMDILDNPNPIKEKNESSYKEYFAIFDFYTDWLKREGMPISSWIPLTAPLGKTMYIPSNDFSCMISTDMFEEFFLQGIIAECKHFDYSIYHLDGPDAIQHLDILLQIPELNAIQWVPTAGQGQMHRWVDLCKKILESGKSLYVDLHSKEDLDIAMANLPSKGLALNFGHVKDEETAKEIFKQISNWN